MDFDDVFAKVNESYSTRKRKSDESEKIIWGGFYSEVSRLTNIVHNDFRKVLDEICKVIAKWTDRDPLKNGAYVLDFKVDYIPQFKKVMIEIEKIKNIKGYVIGGENNKDCPHIYLDPITCCFDSELHPKIKEFKKKYHIHLIGNPRNNCEHK